MVKRAMWKALWQKWTIDKPARLGDWLWDVFVVQLAAFLDGLSWRQIVTVIAAGILILSYSHNIPVSPALLFVGDLVAYMDIFAVLMLLGFLSRIAAVVFFVRRTMARVAGLARSVMTHARRLDLQRPRERVARTLRRLTGRPKNDDDEPAAVGGLAWA